MTDLCPKCRTPLRPGIAMGQTYTRPAPDFGDEPPEIGTISAGGPGVVIECRKCPACGWSAT